MAYVRARVSFSGIVTMGKGEEKEIPNEEVVKDLVSAGYVNNLDEGQVGEPDGKEKADPTGLNQEVNVGQQDVAQDEKKTSKKTQEATYSRRKKASASKKKG